ncbi:MAG: methyltransferase domain-containing protein [Bacteroidota bacterium]
MRRTPRKLEAEQLDNLQLQGKVLKDTLSELAWINRSLGAHRSTKLALQSLKADWAGSRWTLVDLGCGGGDTLIAMGKWIQENGLQADLIGIDGNPHSLAFAQAQASQAGLENIEWRQADIFEPTFRLPACHVVMANHFLYHFPDEELVDFLTRQGPQAKKAWLIGELSPNFLAGLGFNLMARAMGWSAMTRQDGLLAIKRALRKKEWQQLLSSLPGINVRLHSRWAFRLQILLYL